MTNIMISYRRDDTAGHAGRLYDRLSIAFGRDKVFRDVDKIKPAENFSESIHEAVQQSTVVLALIGKQWARVIDAGGGRRLDDPDDYVRREIVMAMDGRPRLMPVLVGGGQMPVAEELPDELQKITTIHAFEIRDDRFDEDVGLLMQMICPRWKRLLSRHAFLIISFLVVLASVLIVAILPSISVNHDLRSDPRLLSRSELRKLVLDRDFFDSARHPEGTGIDNEYKVMTLEGKYVVIDRGTKLVWQRGGSDNWLEEDEIYAFIDSLNENEFAGFQDWRLPTVEEALSILEPLPANGDLNVGPVFDPRQRYIWTADRLNFDDGSVHWVVSFLTADVISGNLFNADDRGKFYVRAVRSGLPESSE